MVVSAIEAAARGGGETLASRRRLDLHAWVAIGVAALVTVGTFTLSVIAYARVP